MTEATISGGLIFELIPKIMLEVKFISKDRKNTAQGYKFRGVDDIYLHLQQVCARHGVFSVPEILEERTEERTARSGAAIIYRILKIKYTFFAKDGSSITAVVIGEGQDSGDKASNKAMSVAHKYALLQIFMIPTEEPKDPENESHELLPKGERGNVSDQRNDSEGENEPPGGSGRRASNRARDDSSPASGDQSGVSQKAASAARELAKLCNERAINAQELTSIIKVCFDCERIEDLKIDDARALYKEIKTKDWEDVKKNLIGIDI